MVGLRAFGAHYAGLTRRFAASLGLHPTDAAALAEILYAEDRGEPLSPTMLSRLLPLSPQATTAVLARLEAAGYAARSRDTHDGRRVRLRTQPAIHGPASAFFTPLATALDDMLASYAPDFLSEVEAFLTALDTTMADVH